MLDVEIYDVDNQTYLAYVPGITEVFTKGNLVMRARLIGGEEEIAYVEYFSNDKIVKTIKSHQLYDDHADKPAFDQALDIYYQLRSTIT